MPAYRRSLPLFLVILINVLLINMIGLLHPASALTKERAVGASTSQGLLVILVDSLDPLEAYENPVWRNITAQAAYGLMNSRVAGRANPASTHLSLGSGVRADAPADAGQAYRVQDSIYEQNVGQLFTALTAKKAPANSIIVLPLNRLVQSNYSEHLDTPIGLLGNQLQSASATVALIGNSDTYNQGRRFGALMLMNSDGIIPQGDVEKHLLRDDPSFPFGLRTDYKAVSRAIETFAEADLLAIELGDLSRLDAYRDYMTPTVWAEQRKRALIDMAAYIGQLLESPQLKGRNVLVMAPTPRSDRLSAGKWLTPIWLIRSAGSPALLHSSGSRRPGIVLNTEMAAGIYALTTTGTLGTLRITPHPEPVTHINKQFLELVALNSLRAPVLRTYVIFSISVFLGTWLVLWAAAKGVLRQRYVKLWNLLLLTVAAFPLAALLAPLFSQQILLAHPEIIAGLTIIIATLLHVLCRSGMNAYLAVFAATTVALLIDIMYGSPLIRWSVLGYDVIGGARFYGIGNEYAGVLLASIVMAAGIILHRWPGKRWSVFIGVLLALTAVIVGAPWLGANNGGAAAAVMGFTCTMFFLKGKALNWRRALLAPLLLLITGTAAVAADLMASHNDPSHLGQLALQVMQNGIQPVFTIAGRKLAMNWKLLRYTIWTKVLVISLVMTLILLARPLPRLKHFIDQSTALLAASKGALLTALFLLLFNDSGVVAAATAMIPVTTFLLFMTACALIYKWPVDQDKNPSDVGRTPGLNTLD